MRWFEGWAARAHPTGALLLLALAGCGASLNIFGGPASGPLVSTRVCGVHVDGKTRAIHLRIELVAASALPAGAYIEAEFENPMEGGTPLVTAHVYTGEGRTIAILSPPLQGVRQRDYEVVARIYRSREKIQLLGTHAQTCQSLVDQREMVR